MSPGKWCLQTPHVMKGKEGVLRSEEGCVTYIGGGDISVMTAE